MDFYGVEHPPKTSHLRMHKLSVSTIVQTMASMLEIMTT